MKHSVVVSSSILTIGTIIFCFSFIHPAEATYSIAAADLTNGLIGAAATTCLKVQDLSIYDALYHSIPGNQSKTNKGSLLLTQGLLSDENDPHLNLALELMKNGTDPDSILKNITDPTVDNGQDYREPDYSLRQYGLVNMNGEAASYTGNKLDSLYDFYGYDSSEQKDVQGTKTSAGGTSYVFSAQGNIVSETLVDTVVNAFDGCDLAESLYLALISPSTKNLGDVRCAEDEIVGSIAFLHVESADEGVTSLHIDVEYEVNSSGKVIDPLVSLRSQYVEWRKQQPYNSKCSVDIDTPSSGVEEKIAYHFLLFVPFLLTVIFL
ncbi:hypothetical protein CTEN210_12220 [Chaetoceros tenuissimus]|uniref:Uncharacterized protein n=1 Tax=Chaetoceros tenuissimus TaxID=426638 RepID=A0AAD3HA90_9STRA|nr:hypothetical protein CTEN210_12220 [Chaetoceros tenuissimus]